MNDLKEKVRLHFLQVDKYLLFILLNNNSTHLTFNLKSDVDVFYVANVTDDSKI